MNITTPITELHRVGKTLSLRLKRLGIETVYDLLLHFPFRYEDYRKVVTIRDLRPEASVTIRATVELITNRRTHHKRKIITEAVVADVTGRLSIVWFGQPFITKNLHAGDEVFFSGVVRMGFLGPTLTSPQYEKIIHGGTPLHTARIIPVYPLTAGITQKQIRFLLSQAAPCITKIDEWIPVDIRTRAHVIPLSHAIQEIHFPRNETLYAAAERRLKFDELFELQLRASYLRRLRRSAAAPQIAFHEAETKLFVSRLPYTLTPDQKIAAWEILKDLQQPQPMNRLLQGDVGSGKTVVAGIAAYNTALSGFQSVFLTPTEILTLQHYETLLDLFGETLSIAILTRTVCKVGKIEKTKKELIEAIESGSVSIVIGTHAVLGEDVTFRRLGLVVVDEQHRFGVEQRHALRSLSPHFLSMSATPIPRSLALVLYGDLDISTIRIKPAGRQPIVTRVLAPHHPEEAYERIREEVEQGRQAFVICPLIDGEENSDGGNGKKKTVLAEHKLLAEKVFPDFRVGCLHGKMSAKGKIMADFAKGKIDILVATSVVEVGVDVPNASVMVIEDAERFGLAQLHQFRGRVGRGSHASYCFLFSSVDPVPDRLRYFEGTTDGFALAEYDLRDRGPGDVFGTDQSGIVQLRMASLSDYDLIRLARRIAEEIDLDEYPALIERARWIEKNIHLE